MRERERERERDRCTSSAAREWRHGLLERPQAADWDSIVVHIINFFWVRKYTQ